MDRREFLTTVGGGAVATGATIGRGVGALRPRRNVDWR